MITVYSYVRFSTPAQGWRDSLRRQVQMAEAYCTRRGWVLSKETYHDLGVSARKGRNALVGNLGEFVKAIESRKVKEGSVLIVESLDRISRQGIDEGYDLIKKILKAGITIVTLSPEREYDVRATRSLSQGALEIQLILERAAEESERKSERVAAQWNERKQRARDEGKPVTSYTPKWLEMVNGRMVPIPDKVAVVRRIFDMAGSSYGIKRIVRTLNDEGIPTFGGGKAWSSMYVRKLLDGKAALGEYQPERLDDKHRRVPDGKPIPGYYPPVITQAQWDRAHLGMAKRKKRRGPCQSSKHINVFLGLIPGYRLYNKGSAKRPELFLINEHDHGQKQHRFNYPVFETAILALLKEVPVSVVATAAPDNQVDIEQTRYDVLKADLEAWLADPLTKHSTTLSAKVVLQEQELVKVKEELDRLRAEELNPVSDAWAEYPSLVEAMVDDDARLRVRAALRRCIQEIRAWISKKGIQSWCRVMVMFKSGGVRDYWIWMRGRQGTPRGVIPGKWAAMSVKAGEDPDFDRAWCRGQLP